MDKAWQNIFNEKAAKNLPNYQAACWTKEGFSERLALFPVLLDALNKKVSTHNLSSLHSVLDVGCGSGDYCRLLNDKGLQVTGVDYAQNMLIRARQKGPKDIKYLKADAYDLPFNKKSFDLVISIGALQCVEHYERFVRELCRVAGKAIILSTLRTTSRTNPALRLQNQLKYDSWPTRTFHPDTLIDLLEKNGFVVSLKTKNVDGAMLSDCFFLVAIKKSFLLD